MAGRTRGEWRTLRKAGAAVRPEFAAAVRKRLSDVRHGANAFGRRSLLVDAGPDALNPDAGAGRISTLITVNPAVLATLLDCAWRHGESGDESEPHAHEIKGGEIQPHQSEDGSYTSEHPGAIEDVEENPAAEPGTEGETGAAKESLIPFSGRKGSGRFAEAGPMDAEGKIWKVVLIEEGMSLNGRLYTREVLRDAYDRKIFEGIPAFAFLYRSADGLILDHAPDGVDTMAFPKDVAGFHKNVRFEETSSGKMGLTAEFHFMDDVLRHKRMESWKAGNPALFGFSIDAVGEGDQLTKETVEVKYIVRANSDDLVSHPAAGGRFVRMVASLARKGRILKEDGSMDKKALLLQLISEVEPSLLEGKKTEELSESDLLKMIQDERFSDIRATFAAIAGAGVNTPAASDDAKVAALVNEAMRPIREAQQKAAVEAAIREAKLDGNAEAADLVRDLAAKAPGDAGHLAACVKRAQKLVESAGWEDPKLGNVHVKEDQGDKYRRAIEGAIAGRPQNGIPPFKSLRHMVERTTGLRDLGPNDIMAVANSLMGSVLAQWEDWRAGHRDSKNQPILTGPLTESWKSKIRRIGESKFGLKETVNLSQLNVIFGDSITRQMIAEYALPQLNDWRAITSKIGTVDDTRTQRRERMGQYGDLSVVTEGGSYTAITSPSDEEVTLTVTKYGNYEQITQEALLRNDLSWFARIPVNLSRTAMQNVRKTFWAFFITNPTIFDSVALFAAGHNNTNTNALSVSAVSTGRQRMRRQDAYDGGGSGFHELGSGNLPKYLIVPPELENTANQISSSQFEPSSNLFQVANLHRGLQIVVVDHATSATAWWMSADPSNTPTFEVDFVGNSDAPELWTQDDPTQGEPFNSDQIRVKVRNWYGIAALDFRGLYRGNT